MVTAWTSMVAYGNLNGPSGSNCSSFGTPWSQLNTSTSLDMLVTNMTNITYLNYTQCHLLDSIYTAIVG
jgi:hypothetical protein